MKNTSKVLLIFILFLFTNSSIYSQINHIPYFHTKNSIDSLLSYDKVMEAYDVFKRSQKKGYLIGSYEHLKFSKLLLEKGKKEDAENELRKGVEKGLVNASIGGNIPSIKEYVIENFGLKKWNEYLIINQRLTQTVSKKNKKLAKIIRKIFEEDQKLRHDIKKKRIKGKWSVTAYGASYRFYKTIEKDTSIHDYYMKIYNEFYAKDSINKQKYVDIVLDLGYIPDEKEFKGLAYSFILLIHSGNIRYLQQFTDIVKQGVYNGKVSAATYGWYMGLKSDYQKTERIYYFSQPKETLLEFPKEKINKINIARKKIGLKPCPGTIWNQKIYNQEK